jgi:hypothetical protein
MNTWKGLTIVFTGERGFDELVSAHSICSSNR